MTIRLFNLQGVPADEADEIRALLKDNDIDFYETPRGNWGFSLAAIWLHEDSRLQEAKELIAAYQREREKLEREKYNEQRRNHAEVKLIDKIKKEPALYAFFLLVFATIFWILVFNIKR